MQNERSKRSIRTKTAELLRNMLHTIDANSAAEAAAAGALSARERIAALLDPDTFTEIGAYRCRRGAEDELEGVKTRNYRHMRQQPVLHTPSIPHWRTSLMSRRCIICRSLIC